MNLKSLSLGLATLSLSLTSACVYTAPEPGDVTFAWSFYGASCNRDRQVDQVRVTIPGESLEFGGFYPCSSNGYDGVVLHNFRPGTYDYYLEAIDYSGFVSYTASGRFYVDGSILVRVDLYPTN